MSPFLVSLLLLGAPSAPADHPTDALPAVHPLRSERYVLGVDGRTRAATVLVPARMAAEPALVLALHGVGGDGERLRTFTDGAFDRAAERAGWVLAYPDAVDGIWRDCRRVPVELEPLDEGAFVEALVRRIEDELALRFARVFVVGYSNGGQLAFRLALERPELVDGIATFGAGLPVPEELLCADLGVAVPALLVAGTDDPVSPFRGGFVLPPSGPARGRVRPALEGAAWLASRAGHRGEPARRALADRDPDDGCAIEEHAWTTPGLAPVRLWIVRGGGHTLPLEGSSFPLEVVGRTSRDIDGAAEMLAFFARLPHRDRVPTVGLEAAWTPRR